MTSITTQALAPSAVLAGPGHSHLLGTSYDSRSGSWHLGGDARQCRQAGGDLVAYVDTCTKTRAGAKFFEAFEQAGKPVRGLREGANARTRPSSPWGHSYEALSRCEHLYEAFEQAGMLARGPELVRMLVRGLRAGEDTRTRYKAPSRHKRLYKAFDQVRTLIRGGVKLSRPARHIM